MRKILLLILILSACQKEELNFHCMQVSSALPFTFYRNGVASFNQKQEPGIDKVCFFQPWNCEDEIKLQVLGSLDPDESDNLRLSIKENGLEIETIDFTQETTVSGYVNNIEFSLYDLGLCNKFLSFDVIKKFASSIQNPGFDITIEPWEQDLTGSTWAMFGGSAIQAINPSKRIFQNVSWNDAEYTVAYENARSISFGTCIVTAFTLDDEGNVLESSVVPVGTGTISFQGYVGGVRVRKVGFRAGGTFTGEVTFYQFEPTATGEDQLGFYTDPVDVKTLHRNTRLIYYTNNRNFAGILYDDNEPVFAYRVLSKFFEPRFQQEDESEPDAQGNIDKLSGTVKEQKLLEVELLPPSELRKLTLIFKHNSVWIENEAWVGEEPFEIEKLEERSGLFNASVWLTRKDQNFYTNVG